jgi:hypothetical protein
VRSVETTVEAQADFESWLVAREPALQRLAHLLAGDPHAAQDLGVYLSVRPVRGKLAKKLTGGERLPDHQHPTWGRHFNAGGVLAGWARARSVSHYLGRHQDRWETHFGRYPGDGDTSGSG